MAAQALSRLVHRVRERLAPGEPGETRACEHLRAQGYLVLERNFRCRSGELDIVAREPGGAIVFVEVKERHGETHGQGHEAVTFDRRRRMVRAARMWAVARNLTEEAIRFDVVSVDWQGQTPRLRHDRGAFDSEGR
jgi:putative endonuclease